MYRVTKTYGHEQGLSACFRQPRAQSHCNLLHGYALAFSLTFECEDDQLDANNWCMDFGALKPVKQYLCDTFDHKTLLAESDPFLPLARQLAGLDAGPAYLEDPVLDLVVMPKVGCESFAKLVFDKVVEMLNDGTITTNAWLVGVKCSEHGSNSAEYLADVKPAGLELTILETADV